MHHVLVRTCQNESQENCVLNQHVGLRSYKYPMSKILKLASKDFVKLRCYYSELEHSPLLIASMR